MVLSLDFKEAFEHTLSKLNKLEPSATKLMSTKRFGAGWVIDGVLVVLDPRVAKQKALLRSDIMVEKKTQMERPSGPRVA